MLLIIHAKKMKQILGVGQKFVPCSVDRAASRNPYHGISGTIRVPGELIRVKVVRLNLGLG